MIASGDRIIIGAPGPLAFWTFEVVKALARIAEPAIPVVTVDRIEPVGPAPSGSTGRVLLCHYPSDEIIEALRSLQTHVLYLDEPAQAVVEYLIQATNRTPIEAVRVCTASYVAGLALRSVPGLGVLSRLCPDPIDTIVHWLSRHLAIPVAPAKVANYAAHLSRGDAQGSPLEAAIRRAIPAAAGGDALPGAIVDDAALLSRSVLEPMRSLVRDQAPRPIEWPVEAFYSATQVRERAEPVIDLVGPARMLYHGPYLHLPPARYAIEVIVGCHGTHEDASFIIEMHAGATRLARGRISPTRPGGYRARFNAVVESSRDEVQLQTIAERGAIAGSFALVKCLLIPEIS